VLSLRWFRKAAFYLLYIGLLVPFHLQSETEGKVIAFAGLSGCGKTTMARELAGLCGCQAVLEPEESEWPDIIHQRELYGTFSMWMAFRQMWLPLQWRAHMLKTEKNIVFLDSYFIKIVGFELDEPGMGWLFPQEDPYYSVYKEICRQDIALLPDPDCIVLFDVPYEDWIKLLSSRDRAWDKTPGFLESYDSTKHAIESAVYQLCQERGVRLVRFPQEYGNAREQALRLKEILVKERILRK
jgi:deoxyadenosine/deoxycytidine kinase